MIESVCYGLIWLAYTLLLCLHLSTMAGPPPSAPAVVESLPPLPPLPSPSVNPPA